MFILALVITIAVVVTGNSEDDQTDESSNNNPGRFINTNEFFTLMGTFNGPIAGK